MRLIILAIFSFLFCAELYAACAVTTRTWDGDRTVWSSKQGWTGNDIPDTTAENAKVVSASQNCALDGSYTISCFENDAGVMTHSNGNTLTVVGDYFRSLTPNSYSANENDTAYIRMAGTAPQTFEMVDPINDLLIANNTTVTLTESSEVRWQITFEGTGTKLVINQNLKITYALFDFTIPEGTTVELAAGASFNIAGNLIINGSLRMNPGSSIILGNGKKITVGANGELRVAGASGNIATVKGLSSYINMEVNGSLYAEYFRFEKIGADGKGVFVPGSITKMDFGDFLYINSAGYGLSLASTSVIPTVMDGIGFFDTSSYGNNFNIDARTYNGVGTTIDNHSGISGDVYEADPNNKITWTTAAATSIQLSTNNNIGFPADPVTAGDPAQEFTIFSFSLNQSDTASDITSITFSLDGTASAYDVDYIQVFNQGANCQDKGAQIGSNLTMSGEPGKATITIPAGQLTISDTTPKCIHVYLKTTASAAHNSSIGIGILGTEEVINSQGYSFSTSSGPPVIGPAVVIEGDPIHSWNGRRNNRWNGNTLNWSNLIIPDTTMSCKIATGERTLVLDGNYGCLNMNFPTGGIIDWNSTASILSVNGSLVIGAGYNFQNATLGAFQLTGSTNQGISAETAIPNDLIINNSGGASSIITILQSMTVNGNLTLSSGTLRIPTGVQLTVLGNLSAASGSVLDIQGGGTLALGNGSALTINSGATLQMISATNKAKITSTGALNSYSVTINGTIKANNYSFDHLDVNGLVINSGAAIDPTNYLQNGTFHSPVANNSTFLKLYKAIPGNTLTGMSFSLNGSTATGTTNIYTDSSIGAGTLNISNYSGDVSGSTFDNDNTYLIVWSTLLNTINIASQATAPASAYQGQTYNMGRFSFTQALTGASYVDTDITSFILTLAGNGSANDIDQVRLYYDNDCNGIGGVQVGTATTFSGNPAIATFSGMSGTTIPAHLTTPPTVCLYVEFDIAPDAASGQVIGVELNRSDHFLTADSYEVSGNTVLPLTLGTSTIIGSSTIWTGSVNTDWFNAGNWNGGVPTKDLNCFINNATNSPSITSGTGICNSIEIGGGAVVNVSTGATLQLYGSLDNLGTFNNNGTLELTDDGVTSKNQNLSGITALSALTISKTAGGTVRLGSTAFTIGTVNMNGSGYYFAIYNSETLTLTNALNINGGIFYLTAGANLAMSGGPSINVAGGQFNIGGTHDMYPQSLTNKGRVYGVGGTRWSFNATSGSVYLKGFLLDDLDTNGVVIGGNTSINYFGGGQFRNLSESYASVKGIQINTTGSIPATVSDVGWNWSPDYTFPQATDGYNLVTSTGCGGRSIEFVEYFGDWFDTVDVNGDDKVTTTNCTVTFGNTQSAVALRDFTATAYNGAVDLRWSTTLETNHLGFNVFRSEAEGKNFIQLNEVLIMNLLNSSTMQGNYQFLDFTAANDTTYYYYIEDVETNGTMRQHGPVIATPMDNLGNDYADTTDTNSGGRNTGVSDTPSGSVIENNGYRDLGDGVVILSKTSSTLRLQVTPGALTYSDSSWNASYKQVAINGYQRSTDSTKPELLEKYILVEVNSDISTAQLLDSSVQTSFATDNIIAPAPTWVTDGGDGLVEEYSLHHTIYSTDTYYSDLHFILIEDVVAVGNKKFIKIKVTPLAHNPVQSKVRRLDQLTIEIGLNGKDWGIQAPSSAISPYNAANALKIYINKTGFYKISYDDLVDSYVSQPFVGAEVADLRMYYLGEELPVTVTSADSLFNSGDTVEFFAKYNEPKEDIKQVLILSNQNLMLSSNAPLRIGTIDGNPSGIENSDQRSFKASVTAEQNLIELMDAPLGTDLDHFYWVKLLRNAANDGYSTPALDTSIVLENVDYDSDELVTVKVHVKGTHGYNINLIHNLGLYINDMDNLAAQEIFEGDEPRVITFNLPVDTFTDGTNTIRIHPLATEVPASDYDVIYINKVDFIYPIKKFASAGVLNFRNFYPDTAHTIDGLTTALIKVLDISSSDYHYVSNGVGDSSVYTDENGDPKTKYSIEFNTNSSTTDARDYFVFDSSAVVSPAAFELNYGFEQPLVNVTNRAEYLLIGHQDLLNVSSDLLALRESQGLSTKAVNTQQIYNEFSDGVQSSYAIKEFIDYALTYWEVKPKYVLLLGDGSYDPKNLLLYGHVPRNIPMPLTRGLLYDVGSDNWFTTTEGSSLPRLAIGRIPTSNPEELFDYINKLIQYESGETAPDLTNGKELTFVSDASLSGSNENFSTRTSMLAGVSSIANNKFSSNFIELVDQGGGVYNTAEVKTQIKNAFDGNDFMITYYGHGAEDIWSDEVILENDDVSTLTNSTLPIVVSLNCLNTAFFYPDDMKTIGETLMMKNGGGAIAFIGSASMTMPQAQMNFATKLYGEIGDASAQSSTEIRLGDFIMKSKIASGDSEYQLDVNNSYSLFGDPAMSLPNSFFAKASPESYTGPTAPTSGGGGCAVFGADGSAPSNVEGILEYLFLILLTLGIRRVQLRLVS